MVDKSVTDKFTEKAGSALEWLGGKLFGGLQWGATQAFNGMKSSAGFGDTPKLGPDGKPQTGFSLDTLGGDVGAKLHDFITGKSLGQIIGGLLTAYIAWSFSGWLPGGLMTRIPLVLGALTIGATLGKQVQDHFFAATSPDGKDPAPVQETSLNLTEKIKDAKDKIVQTLAPAGDDPAYVPV